MQFKNYKVITTFDTTTHGGRILESFSSYYQFRGQMLVSTFAKIECPKCGGTHSIEQDVFSPFPSVYYQRAEIALEGMRTRCGATLVSRSSIYENSLYLSELQAYIKENPGSTGFYTPQKSAYVNPADTYHFNYKDHLVKSDPDKIDCGHWNQAEDIAQYIVKEMCKNSKSVIAKNIKAIHSLMKNAVPLPILPNRLLTKSSLKLQAYTLWALKVREGGDWDHKDIIANKFPTQGNSTRFYHKFRDYEYYYDVWSNIHYGFMGMYIGFSESELLDGAGLEQIGSDIINKHMPSIKNPTLAGLRKFDGQGDYYTVKLGIDLYKEFGSPYRFTGFHLLNRLQRLPLQEEIAPKSKDLGDVTDGIFKLKHRCYHNQ